MTKRFAANNLSVVATFFFVLLMATGLRAESITNLTAEDLKTIIDLKQKAIIVDARTPKEYQDERIPTAILIPVEDFETKHGSMLPDKTALIIFYCNGVKCGKGQESAEKAVKSGYTNVKVFSGGIPVWKEKGYPLAGNKAGASKSDIKKISAETLKAGLDRKEGFTLVDVREKNEFAAGHIKGALNLPLSNLENTYGQLPQDTRIVLYCNSGSRSNTAAELLVQRGYSKIENMEGFTDWVKKGLPSVKGE